MTMKKLLTTENKRNVREKYKNNPIYRTINEAYKDKEASMKVLRFSTEEIFINCKYKIDELLKQHNEAADIIENFWNDIYCDLRDEANDEGRKYEETELETATSCIVYSVIVCIIAMNIYEITRYTDKLIHQISEHSVIDDIAIPLFNSIDESFINALNQYVSQGQYLNGNKDIQRTILPEELASDAAMDIWHKLQDAKLVDQNYKPIGSKTNSSYLAYWIAERLGINTPWTAFAKLWGTKGETLRSYYNRSLNQKKTSELQDKLKKIQ